MSYSTPTYITTANEVPSYYKRLSICIKPNGFSFSRMTVQGTLLTYADVEMDFSLSMSELTRVLKEFFAESHISPFDFEDMRLVIPADYVVWIPKDLFVAEQERTYLESTFDLPEGVACFSTLVKEADAYCVFAANSNVVTAFRIVLPGIELACQHSVLCPSALNASGASPVMILYQRDGRCDFVVCRNNELLLSNSYPIKNDEERLFRVLEIMKNLPVESDDLTLMLCGDVNRSVYSSLKGFVPHISLFGGRPIRFINPEFRQLQTYQHVLVLS